jgi:four helix bundle protein
MHNYKELNIWKDAIKLVSEIYLITSKFPKQEQFGLTNQIRRASVSIASNIAEGSARKSNLDFSRYLTIAIGSLYELQTQLLIAFNLGYLSSEEHSEIEMKFDVLNKMLYRFEKQLEL